MKKAINIIGMIIGVISIAAGIAFAAVPSAGSSTSTPRSAAFGADYYTYQYEATEYAARNAAATAKNVASLAYRINLMGGAAFILAGALTLLHFGARYAELREAAVAETGEAINLSESAETEAASDGYAISYADEAPAEDDNGLEADWTDGAAETETEAADAVDAMEPAEPEPAAEDRPEE